jgi:hypothetical protein
MNFYQSIVAIEDFLTLKESPMKVISQRIFPVRLNQWQEHTEALPDGMTVRFAWNVGIQERKVDFPRKYVERSLYESVVIEVFSYGQKIAKYSNMHHYQENGYSRIDSLKTKDGIDLSVGIGLLRLTGAGKRKERKFRDHKGEPLKYPEKIAIQRLQ